MRFCFFSRSLTTNPPPPGRAETGRSRGGTLAGRGHGGLLRIRVRVFPQRAVAVGRRSGGADGSELIAETGPWPWPVWGQRRGIAAGEPRGCGRPPWVGSARYVKLLAAKLAQYMRAALRAPRCREPWPGSEPLKTVDAQFSVLRRTCSVSELCIISLHANK